MLDQPQAADREAHEDRELIDDRALDSAEGDRFGHADFADELTRTVLNVRTPANIALYGAWGAGKTGLANLVRDKIRELNPKGVRFARFDAFKYAELPLRRHVISQIAEQLGISDSRYSHDLYRETQHTEFNMPATKFARLLGSFLLVLLIVLAVAVGVVAMVAAIAKGSFAQNFGKFISSGLPLAFAPAALVGGFVALAGKTLTFQRTTGTPSTDEEFETLFRDIVKASKAERIVIFVDELDRCSAREVVETLDTVRTFLEVPGCVFIIAADQQVIEQALARKVRQTTPVDVSNPYYSAGSAYLDKVFHYQLALPPLTPRRLSRFALDLVKTQGGLWNEVDRDAIVSILIPTHVRSPRRVKVLLNNFVLAYRLMSRRMAAGQLDGPARDRAPELAKLVCLRTEFPLFAADLPLDARLPQFVLSLSGDGSAERPSGVTDEAWERARQYAQGLLPVETNLAQVGLPSTEHTPIDADNDGEEKADATAPTGDGAVATQTDILSHAQLQQLIAYLSRTQHVSGPRRDLVYLESFGAAFGLEPSIAEQLEDLAVDRRVDEVVRVFGTLDAPGQLSALRLLASRIREAPPGVEGQNAVSTLLQVLGSRPDDDFAPVANELAETIASPIVGYTLRAEDLGGAFILSLATTRPSGKALTNTVLARDEMIADTDLGSIVLANAGRCEKTSFPRVGEILAAALFMSDTPDEVVGSIKALKPDTGAALLVAAARPFAARCATAKAAAEGGEEREALKEALTCTDALLTALLEADDRRPAEAVVQMALAPEIQEVRDLIERNLDAIREVHTPACTSSILTNCAPRVVANWSRWLAIVPDSAVAGGQQSAELQRLSQRLWEQTISMGEKAPTLEAVQEALAALARLTVAAGISGDILTERILTDIGGAPTDAATIEVQTQRLGAAQRFAAAKLIEVGAIADPLLGVLKAMAGADLVAQPIASPFVKHLVEWSPWLLGNATPETQRDFAEALAGAAWLPEPVGRALRLRVAESLRKHEPETPSPFTVEEILQTQDAHESDFTEGLSIWIRTFAGSVDEVWAATGRYSQGAIPEEIAGAIRDFAGRIQPAERLALAAKPIREEADDSPTEAFLQAANFSDCDQTGAVDLLVERFGQASTTASRRKIMRCWASLKPVSDDHRRRLIDGIFLPLVRADHEGYDLAIECLGLVVPAPHGTKRRIGQAFLDEASVRDELRQKAADKLKRAGLARGRGFLGRGTEPTDE